MSSALCVLRLGIRPGGLLLPMAPIVDVRKCAQRGLDTVGEATQKDCLFLKTRCEELREKNLEKNTDLSEGIVYQAMEEGQNRSNCQSRNPGFLFVWFLLPFNSFTWCFS